MPDLLLYESVRFLYESRSLKNTQKTGKIFCSAPAYFAIKDTAFGIIKKRRLSKGIVLCPGCNC